MAFGPGMPVIRDDGVIGQVVAVSSKTSDVLLLMDSTSAIDVISQRSRARGILRGGASGKLRFEYLLKGTDLSKGDEVVTSGLDGVYPKGLPCRHGGRRRSPRKRNVLIWRP